MFWTKLLAVGVVACGLSGSPLWADETITNNLIKNADFLVQNADKPSFFDITGDVQFRYMGDDTHGGPWCVQLNSATETGGQQSHGALSQTITGINAATSRWYRFSFRGLPAHNFSVDNDGLDMKVEYFQGDSAYDGKTVPLYSIIQEQRKDLSVNGDQHVNGAATWHTYDMDVMLPTPLIDRVRVTVEFAHGNAAKSEHSQFFVMSPSFTPIAGPTPSTAANPDASNQMPANLIHIGGRFYYQGKPGDMSVPSVFDYRNADKLIYHDNRWSAPFAGSMTSWLRTGDIDLDGNTVKRDRLLTDNVTVSFDNTSMIIHTHGIPNHPTGKFPGENPNYIIEKDVTYYIPLNPVVNPQHVATDLHNVNHALNMGPVGIATNGVVFFNPFDAGSNDASNIMDYCCGHPSPDGTYHYHKYPICINSPWADEGKEHSPLIGWAFDGFPIYGPYASAGVLAKDVTGDYALNTFNLHTDSDRGPHYQVTPGQFPYIIGGYWGSPDQRDIQHGPPGGGGGRMGGGFGPPMGGGFGPPPP